MRYREPVVNTSSNQDEEDGYVFDPRQLPTSEESKNTRFETTLEKDPTITDTFIGRHADLLRTMGKFAPLANHRAKYQKQIEQLRRIRISLCGDSYLDDYAEQISIESMADAQFSRGVDGFYTKERNTMRQRFKDESQRVTKKSFFKTQPSEPGVD